jgi:hypothetical protein
MTPPTLIARRKPEGSWHIEVTWPNGKKETVGDYPTAAEAEVEIKVRLEAWDDGWRKHGKRLEALARTSPEIK